MTNELMEQSSALAYATRGKLILASTSPRRRDILSRAGFEFLVQDPEVDETALPNEEPEELVVRLAMKKALSITIPLGDKSPRRWVIGSDTAVVLDREAIGKPRSPEDAVTMLKRLVGRTHQVITAVAIADTLTSNLMECAVESRVSMRNASLAEIRDYVSSGESMDKAGGYALQGRGRRFVTHVQGSESNVIGLPLAETISLISVAIGPVSETSR